VAAVSEEASGAEAMAVVDSTAAVEDSGAASGAVTTEASAAASAATTAVTTAASGAEVSGAVLVVATTEASVDAATATGTATVADTGSDSALASALGLTGLDPTMAITIGMDTPIIPTIHARRATLTVRADAIRTIMVPMPMLPTLREMDPGRRRIHCGAIPPQPATHS
jgi:hypothetical protein